MLDVAVVGAGPIGSRAAYRLAQMGYSVTVLEKRPCAGLKNCCTGIISQECITKFNIPPNVIYRQVSSAKLFSPSGHFIKISQPQAQASVVNRSAFDLHLAEKARKQGVRYLFNTSVEYLESQREKVVLSCKSEEGTSTLEARTTILACGFNTALVSKIGLGQCRYFTTGVQAEVQVKELKEIEIFFGNRIAPGFFAWLVPTHDDQVLAGMMTNHAGGAFLKKWISELVDQKRIEPGIHNICYAGIPIYPLKRTYGDRLLVIGDAAGQVKPTTGGGIYFGLLCADIAADTLHKCFTADKFTANNLSPYQHEWHKILRKELRTEYLARRMYQNLSDARLDKIFAMAKSGKWADRIIAKNRIAFDWHGKVLFRLIWTGLFSIILDKIRLVFRNNK